MDDQHGVTESVGTAGLLAIMFVTSAAMGGLIMAQTPADPTEADLVLRLEAGAAGWGTGDEKIIVRHDGGASLKRDDSRLDVNIGGVLSSFKGAALDGGFSDGWLHIGESWTHTTLLAEGTDVALDVYIESRFASSSAPGSGATSDGFQQKRLYTAGAAASSTHCRNDVAAPFVGSWKTTPSDLSSTHSDDVTIDVRFTDDCAGVTNDSPPKLYHRVNDGSDPAWSGPVDMTFDTRDTFTGIVPEPAGSWVAHKGQNLEYYVDPQAMDAQGNANGASAVQIEAVDDLSGTVPTASFTWTCIIYTCSYDASASSDPDGTITDYDWEYGDSTTGSGKIVAHLYPAAGIYEVNLTVTDNDGWTDEQKETVLVPGPNDPPTAAYTYSCTFLACSFDGTSSSDTDGLVTTWAWDFGDGNVKSGAIVAHTFASPGTYDVKLTVTDDDMATGDTTKQVSVSAAPGMHVHDIDHNRKGQKVIVKVWVRDDAENQLQGASVTATVCKSGGLCQVFVDTTNSNGVAKWTWQLAGGGTYQTCVDAIVLVGYEWRSAEDHAGSGSCETESV